MWQFTLEEIKKKDENENKKRKNNEKRDGVNNNLFRL